MLEKLEKCCSNAQALTKSTTFAVGDKLSYADVCVWSLLRDTFPDSEKTNGAEAKAPTVVKIADMVGGLDSVKSWLNERPTTMF